MQVFHFGSSSCPMLGAYHPPRGRTALGAVLLCSSIGTEYLRTHWAMRRLADQLSRAGMAVLRFDYHGLGDSSLNVSDVDSLDVWQSDVAVAAEELQNLSACESLAIVGLRFGAAIAQRSLAQLSNVEHCVYWEPVFNGRKLLQSWRSMHHQQLDLWPTPVETERTSALEELLGTLYRRSLLREIDALDIEPSPESICDYTIVGGVDGQPLTIRQEYGDWNDLRYLETAWLPVAGPATIVQLLSAEVDSGKAVAL